MTYANNDNISAKSDIGTTAFGYGDDTGPYALTGLESSTSVIPTFDQDVTYTSFQKVSTITENDTVATFIYNSDNERAKMEVTRNDTTILARRYVGGSYMEETVGSTTTKYTYIGGDAYTAPVIAVTSGGTTNYYYLFRDHLGNITHQVNTSNTIVAEYSFDAWGRRRNPSDWSYNLTNEPALFAGRGFTGHEHLPWFNLINMNGRLYDPLVGRMLSPDPYVQIPDYTQNYNRYSYAFNNPLVNTDPKGEFILTILAGMFCPALLPLAGAIDFGWMTGGVKSMSMGQSFWSGAWRGGVVAGVGTGLSIIGGAGMNFAQNLGLGIGEGAITGGLDAALGGNNIWKGMLGGAEGGAVLTTLTSDNLNNMINGKHFLTNANVYDNMIARAVDKQEILNYFGFEGTFHDNYFADPGETDPKTGEISYNKKAFSVNYDYLHFIADHEMKHSNDVLSGKYKNITLTDKLRNEEEYYTYIYSYKRRGLYPNYNSNNETDIGMSINHYGYEAGINYNNYFKYNFDRPWWHFIYKIPRRW